MFKHEKYLKYQKVLPKSLQLKDYKKNYQNISTLGNGSFGVVLLAKCREEFLKSYHEDGLEILGTMMEPLVDSTSNLTPVVAVKVMNKRLSCVEDYMRVKEVKFIFQVSSHPCLVQIYDIFVDRVDTKLCIVMEQMNQNLYQLMKSRGQHRFSAITLKSILRQLAEAIRHIHRHGFFHRDIKPENILIMSTCQYYRSRDKIPNSRKDDNYVVKLADYGLARHVSNHSHYTSYISTRWYRSPEILLRRNVYSMPIDIWAFGAVAVEIATFRPLFPGSNELDQTWKILEILGSPSIPENGQSFNSFGGRWEEAQVLAGRLGFSLPPARGVQIADILPQTLTEFNELGYIVQKCLTWSPEDRANIEWVCSQSYFKGTSAFYPYEEPKRWTTIFVNDENLEPKNLKHEGGGGIDQLKNKSKNNTVGEKLPLASLYSPLYETGIRDSLYGLGDSSNNQQNMIVPSLFDNYESANHKNNNKKCEFLNSNYNTNEVYNDEGALLLETNKASELYNNVSSFESNFSDQLGWEIGSKKELHCNRTGFQIEIQSEEDAKNKMVRMETKSGSRKIDDSVGPDQSFNSMQEIIC